MKKTIRIFSLLTVCLLGLNLTSCANNDNNKEAKKQIIEKAREEIVCKVCKYLWKHYEEGDAPFPLTTDNCIKKEEIEKLLLGKLKKGNRDFVKAINNQSKYTASGDKNYNFKITDNEKAIGSEGTLQNYVNNIIDALVTNRPERNEGQHKTIFDALKNDLNSIVEKANNEINALNEKQKNAETDGASTDGEEAGGSENVDDIKQRITLSINGEEKKSGDEIKLTVGDETTIEINYSVDNKDYKGFEYEFDTENQNNVTHKKNSNKILLTASNQGEVKLIVKPKYGETTNLKINVKPKPPAKVRRIEWVSSSSTIKEGEENTLKFNIYPSDAKYHSLSLIPDKPGIIGQVTEPIADINDGESKIGETKIKAIKCGQTNLTLKVIYSNDDNNTFNNIHKVTVVQKEIPIESITIKNKDDYKDTLIVGDIIELEIEILPPNQTTGINSENSDFIERINEKTFRVKDTGTGSIKLFSEKNNEIADELSIVAKNKTEIKPPKDENGKDKGGKETDKQKREADRIKEKYIGAQETYNKFNNNSLLQFNPKEIKNIKTEIENAIDDFVFVERYFGKNEKITIPEIGKINKNEIINMRVRLEDVKSNLGGGGSIIPTIIMIVIIVGLIAAIIFLLRKSKKMHDELNEQLNTGEDSIKQIKQEINQLRNEKARLQSDYDNLYKDNQFHKSKVNQLTLENNDLKKRIKDSGGGISESGSPQPPPQPQTLKKYAFFPDSPDGFSISDLKNSESRATIYELTIDSESSARFRINSNPDAQRRAMNDTSTLLEKACDYLNGPNDGNSIETVNEGRLQKSGTVWKIIEKAKIKFV